MRQALQNRDERILALENRLQQFLDALALLGAPAQASVHGGPRPSDSNGVASMDTGVTFPQAAKRTSDGSVSNMKVSVSSRCGRLRQHAMQQC